MGRGSIASSPIDPRARAVAFLLDAIPLGHRKVEKVAVQPFERRVILVAARRGIAEHLARACDLPEPPSPPGIGQREIQQLEGALERPVHESLIALAPTEHPAHLGADVRELRRQSQLTPATGRELRMMDTGG